MPDEIQKKEVENIVKDILIRYIDSINTRYIGIDRLDFHTATNAQITANQNNYAIGNGTRFRLSTDAARNITGITGGADGKMLIIHNVGGFNIVLQDQNAGSLAGNRIITGTGADLTVATNQSVILTYDVTTARWRIFKNA